MTDSNENSIIYDNENQNHIIKHNNQKIVSVLKHFLDYLPTTLIKLIFEKNIIKDKNVLPPIEYKFNSCFLYIDITVLKNNFIINKNHLNKEIHEIIYSYISKNIEELSSILIDNGCDVIFYGTGLHAFIIPDLNEELFFDRDNSRLINKIMKLLQLALEIKKNF